MSRIDEALRAWEGSVGRAPRDIDAVRSHPLRLREFPSEPSTAHGQPLDEPRSTSRATTDVPLPPAPVARDESPATPIAPVAVARAADTSQAEAAAARLVTTTPHVFSVEQYRRLVATLHDAQTRGGLKSVLITSAAPREGKTLTGVNLALTLSESYGRRVLLVDADLRCPGVHAVLGVPNTRGLSEALVEDRDLPIMEVSSHLSVLTAGQSATPLASLSSPRMRALLEECERRFDWVVVDTPPIGVLPDAQLLTRLAGAVVLVIAANTTPAAQVARAVESLEPERIIGIVLNRVEAHAISDASGVDRYHATETAATS
jgi:capsular exopolysaccharide synthesis family protein